MVNSLEDKVKKCQVKELVKEGHEVVAVMRGSRVPYGYKQSIWDKVKVVNISRQDLYESDFIEKENIVIIYEEQKYNSRTGWH